MRESVHFIRRLMQLAPDIVHVYDFRTQKLLYVNRRLTDVLGYTEDDLPALNHSLVSLVIEPDPRQLGAFITQRLTEVTDGEVVEYEFTVRHKDGTPRVIRTRGSVLRRDETGQPLEVMGVSEDVTTERQALAELRRREAQLAESQRLFQFGSWEWEIGSDRVRWSDELLRIFGYEPNRLPGALTFDFYLSHIPPGERERIEALASHLIATRQSPLEFEHDILTPSGAYKRLRVRGVLAQDETGQITAVNGTSADITAEYEFTRRIRRSEDRLKESQRQFHYGNFEWRVDDDRVCFSDELLRIFGYEPAAFADGYVPRGFYLQHVAPEDRDRVSALSWENIRAQKPYQLEHALLAADGSRKRLRLRGEAQYDESGAVKSVSGTAADITAEYEAAERLRENEAVRRDVEQFFGYGSWVWDLTGDARTITWSVGNARLFGYEPAELPDGGRVTVEFFHRHVHPDDLERVKRLTDEALRNRDPNLTLEFRAITKGGEVRHFLRRARLILDEQGRPLRYVGTNADVTDERQLAEQLRHSEELNRRINELSPDFISVFNVRTNENRYIGRPLYKALGYGEAEVKKHGSNLFFALEKDDWDTVREFQARVPSLTDGEFLTYQVCFRAKDGRRVCIRSRITVFSRDEDGLPLELMSVAQDVTEQELQAQRLRQSEAFNRHLLELSPDFINVYNLQTSQNLSIGKPLYKWLGYSEEEFDHYGRSYQFILETDEERESIKRDIERVQQLPDGQYLTVPHYLRAKDGRRIIMRNRTAVFSRDAEGRPLEIMTISQDVTEREAQAEALRQSEAINRRVLTLTPDLLGIFNVVTRRTRFFGRSIYDVLGYSMDEVEAQGGNLFGRAWDDAERAAFLKYIESYGSLPDGEIQSHTVRLRHRDGRRVVVYVRGTVFSRDANGQPVEIFVINQDVTEASNQAERLQESEAFNRRLVELSPDVIGVFDLRTQRMRYVGRNTIRNLLGYTDEEVEALGGNLLGQYWDEAESQRAAQYFGEVATLPDGETRRYLVKMRHRSGRPLYIHTRAGVFSRNPDGTAAELMSISQDVTLREELFEQLKFRDDLLDEAQSLLRFGGWELKGLDADAYWTPGLYRVMGHDLEILPADHATTALFRAGVHPDDAPILAGLFQRAFATGESFDYEYRFRWPNGEWHLHAGRGRGFSAADGTIRLVGATADVTDERRLLRSVQRSEALLAQTEDLLQFGSWEWDVPTGQITWSAGLWRIFGYNDRTGSEPVTTELFFGHLHPDDRARMEATTRRAFRQPAPFEFEYRITDAQGQPRTLAGRGVPLFDDAGQLLRLVGNTRDVTDEKEAAERVRKQEWLLREAEDLLRFGSWEWDLPANKLTWSEGLYAVFGYGPDNRPDPLNISVLARHLHPDDEAQNAQLQERVLAEKPATFKSEFRIITVTGEERWLHQRGLTTFDETGQLVRMIGSSADVTELKQSQVALEERLNALNRSNADLEQFAYVASHDLQEPLRKITAFGDRLTRKHAVGLTDEGRLYLERMTAAAARMQALIDNLLSFSRVARRVGDLAPTDLNATVRTVLGDLELKAAEKEAQITVGPLPTLRAVPSQMQQLFQNLLSNALKFSRADVPPVVSVRAEHVSTADKVAQRLDLGKKYVRVLVQDNGIGFDPVYAEKIFDLFQRLHGRSEYEGTGLGLAIVKKIVENHHGLIFAESAPGEGARFTVVLPLEIEELHTTP
jgi:PAS domain S-box-containing protein